MAGGYDGRPQIVIRFQQNIEKPREVFLGEPRGVVRQAGAFIRGRGDKFGIRAAHARHQQVAKVANGFPAEVLQVLPVGDQAVDQRKRAFGRLSRNRLDQIVEHAFGDDAEEFAHLRVRDRVAGIRHGLLEQRQPVAQAAFGRAREHRDGSRIDLEVL